MKLEHVLKSRRDANVELGGLRSDELKRAARFWLGKEAGSYNKDRCFAALTQAMKGEGSTSRVETALSETERQVLSIFTRYGNTVPGGVLTAEMQARGLAPAKGEAAGGYTPYSGWRENGIVRGLCEKLVLVGYHAHYYSSYFDGDYPRLSLHPALVKAVKPATPVSWKPSRACDEAAGTGRRSSSEVALDLWRVAATLRRMGTWTTVKGDLPSKATRLRLKREVGLRDAEKDPLSPPDPEPLFYELLHGMGFVNIGDSRSWIHEKELERHLEKPPAVQAWHWVRAWLHMSLWQDGVGVVPDRDSYHKFVRIGPTALARARELLAWALCGVAHASNCWLDLEVFLRDFWRATRQAPIDFYCHGFTWDPEFEIARKREKYPVGEDRELAYWFSEEAVWVANAIMVTLFTLGLVERGQTLGRKMRPCFRLTELGRVVFGAPEIDAAPKPDESRFLTVQPNLEVVAYLDSADAPQICTLSRFAAAASKESGPVQKFLLRRESLYEALESGMTLDEVRGFLAEHGKTELPANVERMLSDWAGRRESLVLRRKVILALGSAEIRTPGRPLNSHVVLLPSASVKTAAEVFAKSTILDHEGRPERTWTADELGNLTTNGGDSISRLRLARIADRTATGWQITQASVGRARTTGLTADQILGWLAEHLTAEAPALLEVAVRNWMGRQSVKLSQAHLLQIVQPQAKQALLHSPAFCPLLAGHIPPEWFLIREDHLSEVRSLLERLGFTISDCLDPQPLATVEPRAKAAAS